MKILIVDDNQMMRTTVKLLFHSPVNCFAECDDGSKAAAAYADFHPDLVLMDVKMKTVNGISATKQICQQFPDAKIIIITDYDDDALRKAAADAGASGYVMKEHLQDVRQYIFR